QEHGEEGRPAHHRGPGAGAPPGGPARAEGVPDLLVRPLRHGQDQGGVGSQGSRGVRSACPCMVRRLAALALALAAAPARAEHDSFLVGDGGTSLTVSTASTVLNDYAQVAAPVNVADRTLSVTAASVSSTTGFAPGKLVMLIQVTGSALPLISGNQSTV